LLIGVSEYEGLSSLPSAVEDVDALYRVLVDPERGEFLAENVTALKNPDRQKMEEEIYWLFHNRQRDDLLLFYFSGHGIKDDRNNLYLGTSITCKDKGALFQPSAVAATYLHQQIEASGSQHQVIILDSCFSGAIAKGMSVKDDGIVKLEDYLGGKGRAILTSSTATEYSFGAEPTEHGDGLSIYTRYLVEGIATGAADLDEDDWISVDELHKYASKKVKQAAPAMTPKFYPVEEGYKIRLAKSRRDDPKLKYQREFQKRAEEGDGKFSIFVRRILSGKQQEWGISPEEAKEIENRVLQPYSEYQHKLAEYEQTLTEAAQHNYPFSDREQADLKEYQQHLKLRDEDIVEIDRRVLRQPIITDPKIIPEPNLELSVIEFTLVKVDAKGEITDQPQGEAEIFVEDLGDGVSLTMVKIPGGEFLMDSPTSEEGRYDDESPQHLVKVPEFYLGQTLVTQAQWQQIMGTNPSYFTGDGKLPIEQVSWVDSQEFCQKLSAQTQREYRLPSEAEWEYACRSKTTTPFCFGETISSEVVNYRAQDFKYEGTTYSGKYREGKLVKYREKTTLVSEFPPNAFGLYDLHGNLWEWCQDHWHKNYEGAPTNGSSWLDLDAAENAFRVLRGGSWNINPRFCRSASRFTLTPVNRFYDIGFRVVCEIPRTL
jgi:formylglycine-generating enzyme required for sulfatase activity